MGGGYGQNKFAFILPAEASAPYVNACIGMRCMCITSAAVVHNTTTTTQQQGKTWDYTPVPYTMLRYTALQCLTVHVITGSREEAVRLSHTVQ